MVRRVHRAGAVKADNQTSLAVRDRLIHARRAKRLRDDLQGSSSQLPAWAERAMLEILTGPDIEGATDPLRRERELGAVFLTLDVHQAHALLRRFDTGDDPLAQAFRTFIRRRR